MQMHFRRGVLAIELGGDDGAARDWLAAHAGEVFLLRPNKSGALVFHSLGPQADACREPINITSRAPMPLRLISNFFPAPFVLDGQSYAGVEGFWQGLKFPDAADRRRLAALVGSEAKDAGFRAPPGNEFAYQGRTFRVGTCEHWQLMASACHAKFEQNEAARRALLATGKRPIEHRVKPDSRTIPGAIMAQIWMRIRDELRRRQTD
jgi:predicted NAD-dependent protein-ADP-ribosyltransferase YbiA (DUF1768 family)